MDININPSFITNENALVNLTSQLQNLGLIFNPNIPFIELSVKLKLADPVWHFIFAVAPENIIMNYSQLARETFSYPRCQIKYNMRLIWADL